jgi:hypothetical protein
MEEALALSERVGDTFIRPRMLNTVGWVYGELQDHERAMGPNWASMELASVPGFHVSDAAMHARLNLGDNLVALGRPDEAEEQFRVVEEVSRSPRPADRWLAWRYSQHLFHSYGELWLSRGETERAMSYASVSRAGPLQLQHEERDRGPAAPGPGAAGPGPAR